MIIHLKKSVIKNNLSFEDSLKKRCIKIINKINKDFPELVNKRIKIKIANLQGGSMWAGGIFHKGIIIVDLKKYENAKDSEIIGALVHEMVHIKDYYSWSFIKYFYYYLRCSLFRKGYKDIELRTDKETIERGYAKELYDNRNYRLTKAIKEYRMKQSENYLMPQQIKFFAKSINKWGNRL